MLAVTALRLNGVRLNGVYPTDFFLGDKILTTLPKDIRSPCVGAAPDSGAAIVNWLGSGFFQMADGQCAVRNYLLRCALSLKIKEMW